MHAVQTLKEAGEGARPAGTPRANSRSLGGALCATAMRAAFRASLRAFLRALRSSRSLSVSTIGPAASTTSSALTALFEPRVT